MVHLTPLYLARVRGSGRRIRRNYQQGTREPEISIVSLTFNENLLVLID